MGLDSIEILMKVEDTFGIKIPNREAERIVTVGDFHNVVWSHLSGKHSDICKSQSLFYTLRKNFDAIFNFSSKNLKLDTLTDEIFPKINRRKVYLSFATATNLKLPELALPINWVTILNTFGIALIFGGLVTSLMLIIFFDYSKWALLFPVIGIMLTLMFSSLLNFKRTVIEEKTIRVFTEHVLALNYSRFLVTAGTNRQEMEKVINHIIADMVGLDLEEITPHKKIVDDLGID